MKYESRVGVGLLPIGQEVKYVQTTGLKWNLGDTENNQWDSLSFLDLISSSNEIVSDCVTVKCSGPLLFSTTLINAPKH